MKLVRFGVPGDEPPAVGSADGSVRDATPLGGLVRALVPALLVAFACRALPSATPLEDSGSSERAVASRDRRGAVARSEAGAAGVTDEIAVTADASAAPPGTGSAHGSSTSDAGTTDAGSAVPSADATAAVKWPGEYVGNDRFVRRFDGGEEDVQLDDKARTRVEEPSPSALVISIINSATGDVLCALKASASGNQATLATGQLCFGDEDGGVELTGGRATLQGDRLVLDFEGRVVIEDGETSVEGSYHFEGLRK